MARLDQESSSTAAYAIEHAVADAMAASGWTVEKQPLLGAIQPDFLVSDSESHHLVVEIKVAETPINFAAIAQLAESVAVAESSRDLQGARGVLLTTAPISSAAQDAAKHLDVMISSYRAQPKDADLNSLVSHWIGALRDHYEKGSERAVERESLSLQWPAHVTLAQHERGLAEGNVYAASEIALARLRVEAATARTYRIVQWVLAIGLATLAATTAVLVVELDLFSSGSGVPTQARSVPQNPKVPNDKPLQRTADAGDETPLAPILIALAVLGAVSIGAVAFQRRRLHQGHRSWFPGRTRERE